MVFQLEPSDIGAIRFGISPGHELCQAIGALQQPGSAPLLWGWMRGLKGLDELHSYGVLTALIPPTGYFPDFLTTPPWTDMSPADEIQALRDADPVGMRVDLTKIRQRAQGLRRELIDSMLADPVAARPVIADAWEEVWSVTLAPHWDQLHRLLSADISHRTRTIAQIGTSGMVDSLHDRVQWAEGSVRVRMRSWSEDVDCAGRGLLLVPSMLGAPYCSVLTEYPVQPTLFYPAHGASDAWHRAGPERDRALAALLGDGRSRVLRCLDGPRSTTEVAELNGIVASTASHHLSLLRDARLVTSTRDGARMMHARTVLGDALLD